ncbi:MAG: manganese efflux pump MntP family protein [Coriobacteriia bacterium]|nr:manganese efflux pump MntP family protein [Coriobacteriia bacterium]
MDLITLLLLSIGLAMDAMVVTLSYTMCYPNMTRSEKALMPLSFGIFQGAMPIVGYLAGSVFTKFLLQYSGPIVFFLLAFLGFRMIRESINEIRDPGACNYSDEPVGFKRIMMLSIATSIDALAVGISFAALDSPILFPALMIAVVTALICYLASFLGFKLSDKFGIYAKIFGGLILIGIGIKALIG